MKTVKDLTPEEMEKYRIFLREKEKKEEQLLKHRFDEAWRIARTAAKLLYEKYRAEEVVVFGSLTDAERFTKWSDIDIAAWGIPNDVFYKAIGEIISLSPDFKIDVVDPEECRESFKKAIEKEGIKL